MFLTWSSVGPGSACVLRVAFGVSPIAFQSRALNETPNAAPEILQNAPASTLAEWAHSKIHLAAKNAEITKIKTALTSFFCVLCVLCG